MDELGREHKNWATKNDKWIDDLTLSLPPTGCCDLVVLRHLLVERLEELMVMEFMPSVSASSWDGLDARSTPWALRAHHMRGDRKQSLFSLKKKKKKE